MGHAPVAARRPLAPAALVAALLLAGHPARAQQPARSPYAPRQVTAADYARAERFLATTAAPLVANGAVRPTWLKDGRFWYRNQVAEGTEFLVVDPRRGTRERLLDQPKLAAALAIASGQKVEALQLPFTNFDLVQTGQAIQFELSGKTYVCDLAGSQCAAQPQPGAAAQVPANLPPGEAGAMAARAVPSVRSPDGSKAAFIRDFNLWVRDIATGKETQLTTDGVRDNGYATDNAGWIHSDRPILLWSPDSKKIATFQQDERQVGMMYLVETRVGHPVLQAWRYPLPGDSVIQMISRVVIELGPTPRVIRLKLPPDAHRSSFCDHIACRGTDFADVEWYPDGSQVAFVSTSRDHKRAVLRIANAETGAVRDVLSETVPTQYESGTVRANWHVMPATHEAIWFSERSDWGQLYLYDLRNGQLKNPITRGPGAVLQILCIDEPARRVYFTATGHESGRDPYFRHLYRVGFDGHGLKLLTPEDADHDVTVSPDGLWFVDNYSRPDVPPISVLRDASGRIVKELQRADISRLRTAGWQPPISFTVKARDGKTDLYGLMFRPSAFDSTKKYPIVNNIYPGPQTGSVGGRSFSASRGDCQALAELGFIVVQLDAMGTPYRSKSFHDAYYGNMGDNGLPDQVAAMRQLAERYPWIDLERAGIYGHSGGGYAAADAMLRYPDFFKVGISESGKGSLSAGSISNSIIIALPEERRKGKG